MKLKYIHFLSKSNIKGNKNSGVITFLICLFVIVITLVACFTETSVRSMNIYESDYMSRALYLTGWAKTITDEGLEAIENMEHVEVVADHAGIQEGNFYEITYIDDKDIMSQAEMIGSRMSVSRLHKNEKKRVMKGESLDEMPAFSCLIPNIFYPLVDAGELEYKNLNYRDGADYIGKTIKLKGDDGLLSLQYETASDVSTQYKVSLKSPEFSFKVVGTYYAGYESAGNFRDIYVSEETYSQMTEMAMKNSGIDLTSNSDPIAVWWRTPSLHYHYVVVDDHKNMTEVVNTVRKELGYDICSAPEMMPDSTTVLMSNVFKTAGSFLTGAILLITTVVLIQSSVNSIRERKGFIGLMKAIGYKNHQIFASLIYEQLYMTLKAFLIGGAISTAVVLVANYFFKHGTYRQMQYIIDMKVFVIFLGVSFLIALLVPLVTQLLLLRKLVKIQPREAMNTR